MGISSKLAELMKSKNMNANELAKAVGVSPSTIYSALQRDSEKMSIDLIINISHALGVTADELLSSNTSRVNSLYLSPDETELIIAFRKTDRITRSNICTLLGIQKETSVTLDA